MSSKKSGTWRSSSYLNELQKEHKAKYMRKLTLTNGQLLPDPYGIGENWKSDAKLIPDVSWGDMHNYLVNSPSEFTHDNLKTYKSLEAFNFFCVQPCSRHYDKIAKKSEFYSIKTKVRKYLFKHFQVKNLF